MNRAPLAIAAALASLAAEATAGEPPRFAIPVACSIGRTCFVQHFVDIDPGPGVRDWACGEVTYDGHKGTDIRVLSIAKAADGVAVLAAAPGVVLRVRDDMQDVIARTRSRALVAGRECGNGMVVSHGGGWETQYCHLKLGSVKVKAGQKVEAGTALGDVGYSGLADFAHLHFEVRHDGKVVDPFRGADAGDACDRSTTATTGLWSPEAAAALRYHDGEIIETGFASAPPTTAELESGNTTPPAADGKALLFFARFTNLRAGDRLKLSVDGPEGFAVTSISKPIERKQAVFVAYAGKRRTLPVWASGRYRGTVALLRGEETIATASSEYELK